MLWLRRVPLFSCWEREMETESGRDGDSKNLIHSSANNNSPKHLDKERKDGKKKRVRGGCTHKGEDKNREKPDERIKRQELKGEIWSIQMWKPCCQDSNCFTVCGKLLCSFSPALPELTVSRFSHFISTLTLQHYYRMLFNFYIVLSFCCAETLCMRSEIPT